MNKVTIDIGGTKAYFKVQTSDKKESFQISTGPDFSKCKLEDAISIMEKDFSLNEYSAAIAFPGLVKDEEVITSPSIPALVG